jgi:hypothetical protein
MDLPGARPGGAPVTLVQRRIFILPTRHGYFFAATLLLLLVSSINYSLSLGFMLTFLLAGMAGVAMLHTWRNLAHLKLHPGRCDPVFAGEPVHFTLLVETPSRGRIAIAARRAELPPVYVDVKPRDGRSIALGVPPRRGCCSAAPRGLHALSAGLLPRLVVRRLRPHGAGVSRARPAAGTPPRNRAALARKASPSPGTRSSTCCAPTAPATRPS